MLMTCKREELYKMYTVLKNLKGNFSKWFQVSIYDIMNSIESSIKSIEEIIKPSDGFIEFEKKRNQILIDLSKKDENGQPILITNGLSKSYDLLEENKKEAILRINELKMEYKDILKDFEKSQKDIDEIMNSEIEVDIKLIPFKYFPDTLETDVFNVLIKFADRGD